jgi:hypothetical protein
VFFNKMEHFSPNTEQMTYPCWPTHTKSCNSLPVFCKLHPAHHSLNYIKIYQKTWLYATGNLHFSQEMLGSTVYAHCKAWLSQQQVYKINAVSTSISFIKIKTPCHMFQPYLVLSPKLQLLYMYTCHQHTTQYHPWTITAAVVLWGETGFVMSPNCCTLLPRKISNSPKLPCTDKSVPLGFRY